jgi:threonine/homoserine/homoserine lactone efflux protein
MTDPTSFILAVLVVLATPGPTNTLLATAAAADGRKVWTSLMPAEMIGYTISIGALLLLVRPFAESSAVTATALRSLCATYLLYLAATLWYAGTNKLTEPIRFRHVFLTTLLNPKAAIFAFLIFPEPGSPLSLQLRSFGLFIGLCAVACTGWLTLGALIGEQTGSFVTPLAFQRVAATALSIFAIIMLTSILL